MEKMITPFSLLNIGEDELNRVIKVLKFDWKTTNSKIKEFENEISPLENYLNEKIAYIINEFSQLLKIADIEANDIALNPYTLNNNVKKEVRREGNDSHL